MTDATAYVEDDSFATDAIEDDDAVEGVPTIVIDDEYDEDTDDVEMQNDDDAGVDDDR